MDSYCWAADSKRIYFTGCWHACVNLYHTDINGNVLQLTDDIADFGSISLVNNGNKLLATRHSMSQANELYIVNPGKNIKKDKCYTTYIRKSAYLRPIADGGSQKTVDKDN